MRLVTVLLAAATCSVLLGGCVEPESAGSSLAPSGIPNSFATASTEPRTVAFEECHGMGTLFAYPRDSGPGQPPGNWSKTKSWRSEIMMLFYECNEVSWGPFQRGPIRFIWETHTNLNAPENCRTGEYTHVAALHALWVDDAELATYLNDTYGMPTRYATIAAHDNRTGGIQRAQWRWGIQGNPESSIQFSQAIVTPGPVDHSDRLVWFQGDTTLWVLTLNQTLTYSNGQTALTPGTLRPPTLYASSGSEDYVGRGSADLGAILSASIAKFGDSACAQPM